MINKNIPTSLQDFEKIRLNDDLYVDKTEQIYNLIKNQNDYFLSKPRRFGKSLLLSTIRDIFMGKEELFNGLYIKEQTDYNFEEFPILMIDFAGFNPKLDNDYINDFLIENINIFYKGNIYSILDFGINTNCIKLGSLIKKIYLKFNKKVILLVDEYDKIVTSNYGISDTNKYIDILSGFYSGLKSSGQYIRFTLISGLTTILQNDLFSTMNHLTDITHTSLFYNITGYTYNDIIKNFDIQGLAAKTNNVNYNSVTNEMLENELYHIKDFYNGYNFGNPDDTIYNPFDINLLFFYLEYNYYWAEKGRAYLIGDYLKKTDNTYYLELLEEIKNRVKVANNISISSFKEIDEYALLYQAGYLTIDRDGYFKIPNKETEYCLTEDLVKLTFQGNEPLKKAFKESGYYFVQGIYNNNQEELEYSLDLVSKILLHINPKWYYNNPEGIFKSYLYIVILLSGLRKGMSISQEEITNGGYSDITIKDEINNKCIIIEAKGSEKLNGAIQQIKDQYIDYYLNKGYEIILFGIKWNPKKASITYEIEKQINT